LGIYEGKGEIFNEERLRLSLTLLYLGASKRGVSPSSFSFPFQRVERGTKGVRLINNLNILIYSNKMAYTRDKKTKEVSPCRRRKLEG
jgi:hypothetical protein